MRPFRAMDGKKARSAVLKRVLRAPPIFGGGPDKGKWNGLGGYHPLSAATEPDSSSQAPPQPRSSVQRVRGQQRMNLGLLMRLVQGHEGSQHFVQL